MTEQLYDPELLRAIPIFQSLPDTGLTEILNSPDNRIEDLAAKKAIIRESEIGDCMYVIIEVFAEVSIPSSVGGRDIAILRPDGFFWEVFLPPENTDRRNASVRASHQCKLLHIDKTHVLLSVHGEIEEPEDVTMCLRSPAEDESIDLLKGIRLFNSLTDQELASMGIWTEVLKVSPGDFVLKESEASEFLYVALDGSVEIFTLDEDGKITMLAELGRGNYFGEQALLPGSTGKRNAYIRSNNEFRYRNNFSD